MTINGHGRQLDRAAVANRLGWESIGTVNTMRQRSRARRKAGKTENIFPEPDGHVGRSPWWWESTIDDYDRTQRLGRGQPPRLHHSGQRLPQDTGAAK